VYSKSEPKHCQLFLIKDQIVATESENNQFLQRLRRIVGKNGEKSSFDKFYMNSWNTFLANMQSEDLRCVHSLMNGHPELFTTLICEAILAINRTDIENPFEFSSKGEPLSEYDYLLRDAATILLAKTRGQKFDDKTSEFVLMHALMADHLHVRDRNIWPRFLSPVPEEITRQAFKNIEEEFGWAVWSVCELIHHGLPIYERDEKTEHFKMVESTSETYIYLRLRGRQDPVYKEMSLPNWSKQYFFKREHLEAHDIFFSGDYKEAEIEIRRTALQRHIEANQPIKTSANPQTGRKHSTKLLSLVEAVIVRYYGNNFDPTNRETWPTQEAIKSWLKSEHGLSDREAMSVDIIARPDNIRGK
jgi:hypothetical protein